MPRVDHQAPVRPVGGGHDGERRDEIEPRARPELDVHPEAAGRGPVAERREGFRPRHDGERCARAFDDAHAACPDGLGHREDAVLALLGPAGRDARTPRGERLDVRDRDPLAREEGANVRVPEAFGSGARVVARGEGDRVEAARARRGHPLAQRSAGERHGAQDEGVAHGRCATARAMGPASRTIAARRCPCAAIRRVRCPASSGSEPTFSWKLHEPRARALPAQLIAGTRSSSMTGISGTAKFVTDGPRMMGHPLAASWRPPPPARRCRRPPRPARPRGVRSRRLPTWSDGRGAVRPSSGAFLRRPADGCRGL